MKIFNVGNNFICKNCFKPKPKSNKPTRELSDIVCEAKAFASNYFSFDIGQDIIQRSDSDNDSDSSNDNGN